MTEPLMLARNKISVTRVDRLRWQLSMKCNGCDKRVSTELSAELHAATPSESNWAEFATYAGAPGRYDNKYSKEPIYESDGPLVPGGYTIYSSSLEGVYVPHLTSDHLPSVLEGLKKAMHKAMEERHGINFEALEITTISEIETALTQDTEISEYADCVRAHK